MLEGGGCSIKGQYKRFLVMGLYSILTVMVSIHI